MPLVSDMYPSKYLSAADVDEDGTTLTVTTLQCEEMRDGKEKWIVFFKEEKKGLVLNKTNTNTIKALYGEDTDDWEGKQITLYATWTDFDGKQVQAIRVRPKAPKAAKPAPKPAPKPMTQAEADEDEDEDSPF